MVNYYNDITEDAFRFLKYHCKHCKIEIRVNKIFCSAKCKLLYFREIRIKKWIGKTQDKHRVELSDILNEEKLKAMTIQTEKNIEKKMNKLRK